LRLPERGKAEERCSRLSERCAHGAHALLDLVLGLIERQLRQVNKQTSAVTVRSGKKILGEEQHQDFTAADIEKLVETFKGLEAMLCKIRRQIENNRDALSR
jgi:hypothetical protein